MGVPRRVHKRNVWLLRFGWIEDIGLGWDMISPEPENHSVLCQDLGPDRFCVPGFVHGVVPGDI
jgi:hypothetical protein